MCRKSGSKLDHQMIRLEQTGWHRGIRAVSRPLKRKRGFIRHVSATKGTARVPNSAPRAGGADMSAARILSSQLPELAGKPVLLQGWVHRLRNLGGVRFLLLRDRSG